MLSTKFWNFYKIKKIGIIIIIINGFMFEETFFLLPKKIFFLLFYSPETKNGLFSFQKKSIQECKTRIVLSLINCVRLRNRFRG